MSKPPIPRRIAFALTLAFPTGVHAGGLALDPAQPPVIESGRMVRFPFRGQATVLEVLDGVVVHTVDRSKPHSSAISLGGRSWRIPTPSVTAALKLALELQQRPDVDAVFPDVLLPAQPLSNDPYRTGQWYLDFIDMDPLHAVSLGDPSTRVAVIDSGIDIAHPDLVDRIDAPYDAFDDDSDPSPNPGEYCPSGRSGICDEHGTAVAGVVAATANNDVGIHGMCPECTLIPIKMLGERGGSLSADIAAFEHAIAEDAAVINNSWGFTSRVEVPAPLAAVVERAGSEPRGGLGAVVVFAAGNDNREIGAEELQALPGVLCVSAIDNYGYTTSYTNFGDSIDVAAPSATVSITPIADMTTDFGGTSAAAPVVSGLAAWIVSIDPELSAEEVTDLIISTATESPYVTHDADGHHSIYGHGIITPTAILDVMTASEGPADTGQDESGTATDSNGGDVETEGSPKGGCSAAQAYPAGNTHRISFVAFLLLLLRRRFSADGGTAR